MLLIACARLSQWLEADHPDPNGWLLRLLRPVLKLMLRQAKTYSADATIGCMLDYGSLPQHGSDGIKRSIDDVRATACLWGGVEWR